MFWVFLALCQKHKGPKHKTNSFIINEFCQILRGRGMGGGGAPKVYNWKFPVFVYLTVQNISFYSYNMLRIYKVFEAW